MNTLTIVMARTFDVLMARPITVSAYMFKGIHLCGVTTKHIFSVPIRPIDDVDVICLIYKYV
jgi:hypothetical protein